MKAYFSAFSRLISSRINKNIFVLAIGGFFTATISILIFQQFLKMTADELIKGWLKAESVNIQQGNLLSAVSRTQGLILGGSIVNSIQLKKKENGKVIDLIEFGQNRPINLTNDYSPGKIRWDRLGLFTWQATYVFPVDNMLSIHFVFYSPQAVKMFWFYLAALFALLLYSGTLISNIEKRESLDREILLRQAIEDLITKQTIPPILKIKMPFLVEHWHSFKILLEQFKDQEIRTAATLTMSQISKQVAHDIRSPLSALNLATFSLTEIPYERKLLIQNAVQRINDIANDLLKKSKLTQATPRSTVPAHRTTFNNVIQVNTIQPSSLDEIITNIIAEKTFQIGPSSEIKIHYSMRGQILPIVANKIEFERTISNLLNNSIEALIHGVGEIAVIVDSLGDFVSIAIKDNGVGIPSHILERLGEPGLTFGKDNLASGNGLGISHAAKMMDLLKGQFKIVSNENVGTEVTLEFQATHPYKASIPHSDLPNMKSLEK